MKDASAISFEDVDHPVRRESVLQRRTTLRPLLDLPSFNELVRGFCELYQIGVKVLDENGAKLADVSVGNGDFCGYVFSFLNGKTRCTSTVGRVKDGPVEPSYGARLAQSVNPHGWGMIAIPCFTGLRYLIMPIEWEGDYLGRVIFGPFIPDDFQDFPETLTSVGGDFKTEHARELLAKIRRAPESTVAQVMEHFRMLLESLITAGQKTYLTSQVHIEATLIANRDLEQKNRRLEEMNTRLKELDRLKSAFLATVSHELRTPLTSIIGYSEMLSEGLAGPMNGEQSDYVRTIMDKGETLLRLITSILDISQIEAGKVRLLFEPVDLLGLLKSAVSSIKPQAQKKSIEVDVQLPEWPGPRPTADYEKLRQVMVNLLANAVKFTPPKGKIALRLEGPRPQSELGKLGYRIVVEDTGVGIPQSELSNIFQTFYQVDAGSTREYPGAGLGLSIVKSYVEGHGGKILVQSTVGQGATFTTVMPIIPPEPKATQIAAPAVRADRF